MRLALAGLVKFNKGLLRLPVAVQLWLGVMIVANLVAPLAFLEHLEAQVVVGVFFVNLALMSLLTGLTGFSRLVGLGHVLWIPMLWFLWTRLGEAPLTETFGAWLRVVIVLDLVSLVLDAVDVARYIRGERHEVVAGL